MYRQSNHSYASTDSSRRLSSNNPFRTSVQIEPAISRSSLSAGSENRVSTPPQNFEDWVQKNKSLVDMSDDEDFYEATESSNGSANNNSSTDFARPAFPARPVRAGSDSSVNYGSKYV
ncbi:predicted protein [Scheffersomyces stipitis CBS 6054]|uniref:Uncharacterized protein n=1 Tax=Scheffersomyces stipitis (strain ATCC 58785 / CBS 6054 / NBRC 10063 / NRRL Y-11545) TaxID=322104 RepID=A3GH94_PICST|nr:predicted protein [Scheffersomyces stipitis CBS 6054]EAZ63017.1 predicted protein [Scheffersomyces stipitis CBS 6054]KAG2735126.1 hypothetical protein G9P44_001340 [Scheffersomyces stipitis]